LHVKVAYLPGPPVPRACRQPSLGSQAFASTDLVRQQIWAAIRALKSCGMAILIVDKNVADVAEVAQRMSVLEKGNLAWAGAPIELSASADLKQRCLGV
jgi:ABC-type branched-subunit amino acid transport system ATPase component